MTDSENIKSPKFAHLHVHSEYSIMDGSIKVYDLIKRVKELGHTHVAITDHGNMHCAVDFYVAAKSAKITPIIGCEIFHRGLEVTHALEGEKPNPFHLVLLAKNTAGYKGLLRLVSSAYIGKQLQEVPLVPEEILSAETQNMVALSGCLRGEFGFLVRKLRKHLGDKVPLVFESDDEPIRHILSALTDHVNLMKSRFGAENYYIELIDNNLSEQKALLRDLVFAAKHFDIPYVATADAHYLHKDFLETHALSVAIKNSLTLNNMRDRLSNAEFHLTTDEEMERKFSAWPEALAHSLDIAKKCSFVEIELGKYFFPKIDLGTAETPEEALRRLGKEGLQERITHLKSLYGDGCLTLEKEREEYWNRLQYELDMIVQMGFTDYFLIVQDFIIWAKKQGIPVGPGRGSGAGSLVAYALKITDIDPIPYGLIFERFLNPERVSLPDFDVDFCQWRRDEVIKYCVQKYGANKVAQITTFGKMLAKGAVKSVGRAMNISYGRMDRFTKLFPTDLGITLKDVIAKEPRINEEMAKDDSLRRCMDFAMELEGLVNHTSVHAAGVVISNGPMTDYVPVYTTDGNFLITQYEMKPAEKVGLVKFDFLGLKTLTVIAEAVKFIHAGVDPNFDINKIPMDDLGVFKLLSKGYTCGIFQCESGGITQLITKLKPSSFEDIIALVALYRPGPLGSGMVDDFVERKHGRQKITYLHPELEPILKDTYGMILYQEQVQKIAAVLASYSLGEADLLRRAMGKKIPEEMAKQKSRFITGSQARGVDSILAEEIFDLMAEFANYGFNKSHSAAYGLVSYQTAYLKAHFPAQFLAASMTCDRDNLDKIVRYAQECRRLGIKVIPPDINTGTLNFEVPAPGHISFALTAIKGVGESAVTPLLNVRAIKGPFKSLQELAEKVPLAEVGKKTLQLLIEVGAFDSFKILRSTLKNLVPGIVAYSAELTQAANVGQQTLFSLFESANETKICKNAPWDEEALKTARRVWNEEDLILEKKLTGVFLSCHPLSFYMEDVEHFSSSEIKNLGRSVKKVEKKDRHQRPKVKVIAYLTGIVYKRSKKGKLMAYLTLEEPGEMIEALMFDEGLKNREGSLLNKVVKATGVLLQNEEDSDFRFFVESIQAIEEERIDEVHRINLHMKGSVENSKTMVELKKTISEFPGDTPLRFILDFNGVEVLIDTKYEVNPTDAFISQVSGVIEPYKDKYITYDC